MNHNDLGDLRNLITYPLFGQTLGNSIGHFFVSDKASPYPLLISLVSGIAITTLLTKNNSENLDGAYYRAVQPYGADFTFVASLLLYQPVLTTLSHILWPKSNTTLTMSILPNNEKGFTLNRSF